MGTGAGTGAGAGAGQGDAALVSWPDSVSSSFSQVHCNNMHTLGARLPGGVECRFKRGPAMAWEGEPVRHALGGSLGDPRARAVSVPLGGRVGRFLQCRFLFAGPWLLFSEISFISSKPPSYLLVWLSAPWCLSPAYGFLVSPVTCDISRTGAE